MFNVSTQHHAETSERALGRDWARWTTGSSGSLLKHTACDSPSLGSRDRSPLYLPWHVTHTQSYLHTQAAKLDCSRQLGHTFVLMWVSKGAHKSELLSLSPTPSTPLSFTVVSDSPTEMGWHHYTPNREARADMLNAEAPGTFGNLAKLRYPTVVSAAPGAQPKRTAPKTAWHHCLLWHALNIIYLLTYIYIKYIQSAHWHTVFYTFYESYPTTCLCLPEDWNPITALLRTSLRGLKNRDSACLLQNKFCCNFWGWCKALAAVQNNKQYIFYNGSTKIACSISFLGLLVLLFCFKITREEKHSLFWVPFIQCLLLIYLIYFSFLSFAALLVH